MAQMSIEDAKKKIVEEYAKVKADQDKALLLKLQRLTLKSRRDWISDTNSSVKDVLRDYPFLKEAVFIEKEFFLIKKSINITMAEENYLEMVRILDRIFKDSDGHDGTDDEKDLNDDCIAVLDLMNRLEKSISYRGKTNGKLQPAITVIESRDFDPSGNFHGPPRLILTKQGKKITSGFIILEDFLIEANGPVWRKILMLLMVYYVLNLAYPKLYQILGFLQIQILKDTAAESAFQKSVNFKMFEKKYNQ